MKSMMGIGSWSFMDKQLARVSRPTTLLMKFRPWTKPFCCRAANLAIECLMGKWVAPEVHFTSVFLKPRDLVAEGERMMPVSSSSSVPLGTKMKRASLKSQGMRRPEQCQAATS